MSAQRPVEIKLIYSNLAKIPKDARVKRDQIIDQTSRKAMWEIKRAMREPKSGRSYRRGNIKRTGKAYAGQGLRSGKYAKSGRTYYIVGAKLHRASAPGQAPAVDSGAYINSIMMRWWNRGLARAAKVIFTNAKQGPALEWGSDKRHIAPRPHFGPAVEAVRAFWDKEIKGLLGK